MSATGHTKQGSESAFPVLDHNPNYGALGMREPGLTKRELFAAMAMQGLCANPNLKDDLLICKTALALADKLIDYLTDDPSP